MPATPLSALAQVVRSKNAGPTLLTIDLFFDDAQAYALAAASERLAPDAVAALYQRAPGDVHRYLLPSIHAIKYAMPRRICAGNPGDGDVYGAQQHAALLGVLL